MNKCEEIGISISMFGDCSSSLFQKLTHQGNRKSVKIKWWGTIIDYQACCKIFHPYYWKCFLYSGDVFKLTHSQCQVRHWCMMYSHLSGCFCSEVYLGDSITQLCIPELMSSHWWVESIFLMPQLLCDIEYFNN